MIIYILIKEEETELTGCPPHQRGLSFSRPRRLKFASNTGSYMELHTMPWDSGYSPCTETHPNLNTQSFTDMFMRIFKGGKKKKIKQVQRERLPWRVCRGWETSSKGTLVSYEESVSHTFLSKSRKHQINRAWKHSHKCDEWKMTRLKICRWFKILHYRANINVADELIIVFTWKELQQLLTTEMYSCEKWEKIILLLF